METLTASCYCGKIVIELNRQNPFSACYCHCISCRKSHASPLYSAYYVKSDQIKIAQNEDLLSHWPKEGPLKRYFCSNCGSRIKNEICVPYETPEGPQQFTMSGTFPALFNKNDAEKLQPFMHVHCGEAIFPIDKLSDELIRFDGAPTGREELLAQYTQQQMN